MPLSLGHDAATWRAHAGLSLRPGPVLGARGQRLRRASRDSAGSPAFVPAVVEDGPGGGCSDTDDPNETVVLTAWSEVTDGANRIIGRARMRAHYTIGNPWKHSCYDQDGGCALRTPLAACNNNPCIDPSDPRHPDGPAVGDLPIPSDIRCGTAGNWVISADPGRGPSDRCRRPDVTRPPRASSIRIISGRCIRRPPPASGVPKFRSRAGATVTVYPAPAQSSHAGVGPGKRHLHLLDAAKVSWMVLVPGPARPRWRPVRMLKCRHRRNHQRGRLHGDAERWQRRPIVLRRRIS